MDSHLVKATDWVTMNLPFLSAFWIRRSLSALTTLAFYPAVHGHFQRFVEMGATPAGAASSRTVAFEIAKRLSPSSITRFPSYTMIYGAAGAIPILFDLDLCVLAYHPGLRK